MWPHDSLTFLSLISSSERENICSISLLWRLDFQKMCVTPLTSHSLPHSKHLVFSSLKDSQVWGIKETICVLTVPKASMWEGQAGSDLARPLRASPRECNSPKTKVVPALAPGVLILDSWVGFVRGLSSSSVRACSVMSDCLQPYGL